MEKVLIIHNRYQHHGGEDSVVEAESSLLRDHGHDVRLYSKTYEELASKPKWKVAAESVWSGTSARELTEILQQFRPDVVHFHNAFPLVSYGAYRVVGSLGFPIVQTLHNFRWLCAQAQLFRNGGVCEDCLGHFPWRGVVHACYRNSRIQTAASLIPLAVHKSLGTFQKNIGLYIALNEFCRTKFIEGGLPASRIRVKPNFLKSEVSPAFDNRHGALFVGRLSKEKGLDVLAAAKKALKHAELKVIGSGDLEPLARTAFGDDYLGFQKLEAILEAMRSAAFLVVPSVWFENFPRTIVESYAMGLPVIASRLGAMAEIVKDGVTGLHFTPGDPSDLAAKMEWALQHPEEMNRMGRAAYQEFLDRYTDSENYRQLISIYREAATLKSARQAA